MQPNLKASFEREKKVNFLDKVSPSGRRPLKLKLFMSADMSIFTLKELQMQKDPGYRNSSYPESGEE